MEWLLKLHLNDFPTLNANIYSAIYNTRADKTESYLGADLFNLP